MAFVHIPTQVLLCISCRERKRDNHKVCPTPTRLSKQALRVMAPRATARGGYPHLHCCAFAPSRRNGPEPRSKTRSEHMAHHILARCIPHEAKNAQKLATFYAIEMLQYFQPRDSCAAGEQKQAPEGAYSTVPLAN